jgi:hypothetical protein
VVLRENGGLRAYVLGGSVLSAASQALCSRWNAVWLYVQTIFFFREFALFFRALNPKPYTLHPKKKGSEKKGRFL